MGTWKQWLNGVIGAFISSASNCVTLLIVAPDKFSPDVVGGWKRLGVSIVISGAVGAALYLKTHPTPLDAAPKT